MTDNLYAPLRSDTKPLIELVAFARKVARIEPEQFNSYDLLRKMYELTREAQKILKEST